MNVLLDYAIAGLVAGVFTTAMLYIIVLYSEYKEKKEKKKESVMSQDFTWIPIDRFSVFAIGKKPHSNVLLLGQSGSVYLRSINEVPDFLDNYNATHFAFINDVEKHEFETPARKIIDNCLSSHGEKINELEKRLEEAESNITNLDDKINHYKSCYNEHIDQHNGIEW